MTAGASRRAGRVRRSLSEHRALFAVGAAYLVAQIAVSRLTQPYGYDEAVYLSQVAPGHEAFGFGAQRARGLTVLLLPVAPFADAVAAVRAYLALASAAGLVWAFGVWSRVIGARAAAIGAGAFALSWLAIAYGPAAMPHVPVALLGVAAAGYLARDIAGRGGRYTLAAAAAALALATAVRPWDAAAMAAGLALGATLGPGGRRVRRAAALAAGAAVGALPWLVEAVVRFGGLGVRFEEAAAAHVASGSAAFHLPDYVRASSVGLDGGRGPLWPAVAWWIAMAALVVAGIASTRRSRWTPAVAGVTSASALVAAFQFLVPPFAVARFLLPALATGSVAAGVGAAALWRGRRVAAAAGALALAWASWQGFMGHRFDAATREPGRVGVELAAALERVAGGRPCEFASRSSGPQIQFWSGCRWRGPAPGAAEWSVPARFHVVALAPGLAAARRDARLVAVVRGTRMWSILELRT